MKRFLMILAIRFLLRRLLDAKQLRIVHDTVVLIDKESFPGKFKRSKALTFIKENGINLDDSVLNLSIELVLTGYRLRNNY